MAARRNRHPSLADLVDSETALRKESGAVAREDVAQSGSVRVEGTGTGGATSVSASVIDGGGGSASASVEEKEKEGDKDKDNDNGNDRDHEVMASLSKLGNMTRRRLSQLRGEMTMDELSDTLRKQGGDPKA